MSVHVFLEGLQTTESRTEYTYKEIDLLSDIGGNIGLFVGISIISIMEVLVLIFDEIKVLVSPKKFIKKFVDFDRKLRKYIPDIAESNPNNDTTERQTTNTTQDDQVGTTSNEGINSTTDIRPDEAIS